MRLTILYHYTSQHGLLGIQALCLIEETRGWSIFYSERGLRTEEQRFSDENSACEAFLQRLKHTLGIL